MKKLGRNDPCHCGSGKKYKNCHLISEDNKSGKNKAFILMALVIIFALIGVAFAYMNSQNYNGGPGPAPEGKVWSAEHGHWHDVP